MFIYLFHKWDILNVLRASQIVRGGMQCVAAPDFWALIMPGYLLFCQLLIYEVVLTL